MNIDICRKVDRRMLGLVRVVVLLAVVALVLAWVWTCKNKVTDGYLPKIEVAD